jgi:hypothetical protein
MRHRSETARPARALGRLLVMALLLGQVACGGGGGGGGPTAPTPPPVPTPGVTVTANSASGPAITLAQGARSTTTLLVLEVRASAVTGLYGVAFALQYPPALLDYQGRATAGTFLAAGGATVSTQVLESAPGNLVVGLSRLGNVGGADGSGVLLELELPVETAGIGPLAFTRNAAFRADGTSPGLTWAGGSVTVVR